MFDLLVVRAWQAGEDVLQVGVGFDAMHATVGHQRVDHRVAFAGFSAAHEQPGLLAHGRRSDGILDEVVIDLHLSGIHEPLQVFPLVKRVLQSEHSEVSASVHAYALGSGESGEVCGDQLHRRLECHLRQKRILQPEHPGTGASGYVAVG